VVVWSDDAGHGERSTSIAASYQAAFLLPDARLRSTWPA
jgi:hypothetical protein